MSAVVSQVVITIPETAAGFGQASYLTTTQAAAAASQVSATAASSSATAAGNSASEAAASAAAAIVTVAGVATIGAGAGQVPSNSSADAKYVPKTLTVAGHALSGNVTITPSDVGAVPTTTTVNGHALSGNVTITPSDVGAVPTTTTVNGHALSGDIVVTASNVGLSNVANVAQIPLSYLDTDGTLAADLDTNLATQKAVKTYVDGKQAGLSTIETMFWARG